MNADNEYHYLSIQQKLLLQKNGLLAKYVYSTHLECNYAIEKIAHILEEILKSIPIFSLYYDTSLSYQCLNKNPKLTVIPLQCENPEVIKCKAGILITIENKNTYTSVFIKPVESFYILSFETNSPILDQRTVNNVASIINLKLQNKYQEEFEEINYFDYIAWQQKKIEELQAEKYSAHSPDSHQNEKNMKFNFELELASKREIPVIHGQMIKLEGDNYDLLKQSLDTNSFGNRSVYLAIFIHILSYYTNDNIFQIGILRDCVEDNTLMNLLGNIAWVNKLEHNFITHGLSTKQIILSVSHSLSEQDANDSIDDNFIQFLRKNNSFNQHKKNDFPIFFQYNKYDNNRSSLLTKANNQSASASILQPFKFYLLCNEYKDSIVIELYTDASQVPLKISEYIGELYYSYLSKFPEYLATNADDSFSTLAANLKKMVLQGNQQNRPSSIALYDGIENIIKSRIGHVILSDDLCSYTGEELLSKVHQFSSILRNNKVKPGNIVGLALERDANFVIWMLAIFKVGATVLPIDLNSHKNNIDFIVKNANPFFIITNSNAEVFNNRQIINKDSLIVHENIENNDFLPNADQIAYIVYTSGTTGEPKKISISYAGFEAYCHNLKSSIELTTADSYAVTASLGFSSLFRQIFLPLFSGARIVIFSDEASRDPKVFFDRLLVHKITVVDLVPSFIEEVIPYLSRSEINVDCLNLRIILSASEPLRTKVARGLLSILSNVNLINMYGQTETSGIVSFYKVKNIEEVPLEEDNIPIGTPISSTDIILVDQNLNLVPKYSEGQICVNNNSISNDAKKIPIEVSGGNSILWWPTGDLARLGPDEQLRYISRRDSQVKISGKRFNLSRTNTVLESHPAVVKAVTFLDNEKKLLYSFIQPSPNQNPSKIELQHHSVAKIPKYMVPSIFIYLKNFPLTTSRKLDYESLHAEYVKFTKTSLKNKEDYHNFFKTEIERSLYNVFADLLNIFDIKPDDDLFTFGMNSLTSVRAVNTIYQIYNIDLKLLDIFSNPTIKTLSLILQKKLTDKSLTEMKSIN